MFSTKWIKILLIWVSIVPIAILNGGLREYVLELFLPDATALALSGIILSGMIFVIVWLLLPRIKNLYEKDCIITSLLWTTFTIFFEISFGLSSGATWNELLQAYNPQTGNLWIVVVLTIFLTPLLIAKNKQ